MIILLTGISASGKSTVAQALAERLPDGGRNTAKAPRSVLVISQVKALLSGCLV
ncbi:adenylyl-sulfate kinase [Nonomuraea sp. NPDC050536]|uniref:adenylyl-sulfate kinase n=1 Tax=Nonomuraea sp. NPDC050536 TaxID=3364366 RepID=UPI0037C941FC